MCRQSETFKMFPLNLVIRKGRYSLCMVISCWPEIIYSNFIFFSTEKKYDFVKEIILELHAFIKRHISNPSTLTFLVRNIFVSRLFLLLKHAKMKTH